jgi:hypothetical protein
MLKMKKHRKILYFPGMISLLILPLMCMLYFYKYQVFTEYRSMDLHYGKFNSVEFKNGKLAKSFKEYKRNYDTIYITDNQTLNEIKIKEIRIKTKNLFTNNDSINGIKINFEKSNYQNFITVFDNLAIDDIHYHWLIGNEITVIHIPQKKYKNSIKWKHYRTCGYYAANKDYWEKLERERIFKQNIKYYKQKWQIILAYFGIVLLNIFALFRWRTIRLIS